MREEPDSYDLRVIPTQKPSENRKLVTPKTIILDKNEFFIVVFKAKAHTDRADHQSNSEIL